MLPRAHEEIGEALVRRAVLSACRLHPRVRHEHREAVRHEAVYNLVVVVFAEVQSPLPAAQIDELDVHVEVGEPLLLRALRHRLALIFLVGGVVGDIRHREVAKVQPQRKLGDVGHQLELEHVEGLLAVRLRERHVPRRQHHRDDGRAVGEGIVVVCDAAALVVQAVELGEHGVKALPRGLAHEDEVGVFRPHPALLHDVHHFVESELDVRLGEQRIAERHLAARARMHGEDAVVLGDALRERNEFVVFGVDAGLIHKAEGAAERAALHRLVHQLHLLRDLRLGEGRGIVARDAYPRRAVPDERDHVDKEPPRGALRKLTERAGLHGVKETSAHFVLELAPRRHSEGGETAVARHLSGDALPQEWRVILLRVLIVVEKVIVRVRVDEPGRNGETRAVHHLVRLRGDVRSDRRYALAVHQDVAIEYGRPRAVDDIASFEQDLHTSPFPACAVGAQTNDDIKIILTSHARKINRSFALSRNLNTPPPR